MGASVFSSSHQEQMLTILSGFRGLMGYSTCASKVSLEPNSVMLITNHLFHTVFILMHRVALLGHRASEEPMTR